MAGEKQTLVIEYDETYAEILTDLQTRLGKDNHAQVFQEAINFLRLYAEEGVTIQAPEEVLKRYGFNG